MGWEYAGPSLLAINLTLRDGTSLMLNDWQEEMDMLSNSRTISKGLEQPLRDGTCHPLPITFS